jgi:hypothetical protein
VRDISQIQGRQIKETKHVFWRILQLQPPTAIVFKATTNAKSRDPDILNASLSMLLSSRFVLVSASIAATITGALIYVGFGPKSLYVFSWAELIGLVSGVETVRSLFPDHSSIPSWVIHTLPDGLWTYSSTLLLIAIWERSTIKAPKIWCCVPLGLAISAELGQAITLIPGTFDMYDLVSYGTGAAIAQLVGLGVKKLCKRNIVGRSSAF